MIGFSGRIFHTQRLTLRNINDKDRDELRDILKDGTVTEPAGYKPVETEEQFEEFFDILKSGNAGIALIFQEKLIGYCRVYPEELGNPAYNNKTIVGLGFLISREYQGIGLGTEMLKFITRYLKERFDYVLADAFVENAASNRLIKKCGYAYIEDYSMYFESLGCKKTCHSYIY